MFVSKLILIIGGLLALVGTGTVLYWIGPLIGELVEGLFDAWN